MALLDARGIELSVHGDSLQKYSNVTTDDDPLVFFDHENLPENLVIEPPESMRDDLLEDFAAKTEELWRDAESGAAQLLGRERKWLVAGGRGAGSQWHRDPFWTSAYHCLLSGRKLWCFFAPAGAGCLPPGLLDEHSAPAADGWFREWEHLLELFIGARRRRCPGLVRPDAGRLRVDPTGLWHCTLNLEESVAFTRNIVNGRDAKAVRASGLEITRDDPALGGAARVRAARLGERARARAAPAVRRRLGNGQAGRKPCLDGGSGTRTKVQATNLENAPRNSNASLERRHGFAHICRVA